MSIIMKKYTGVVGLILIWSLIYSIIYNTVAGFYSFLGFYLGVFLFFLFCSAILPLITYFILLAIGKKADHQVVFYVFVVSASLLGIMLMIGITKLP